MIVQFDHTSVLLSEAVEALAPQTGRRYLDGTVGGAGHACALLEACAPDGTLICLDRDAEALAVARQRLVHFADRVQFFHDSFDQAEALLAEAGLLPVDGTLLDLGVSSHQLDVAARGFSFSKDGPLDMRMDPSRSLPADALIDSLSENELSKILRSYGEERQSGRIARSIKQARSSGQLNSTAELAALVEQVVRPRGPQRIHPATRTFQALRIAVNDELGALTRFLDRALGLLAPAGRLAIISFHSLEDRIVKQTFAKWANPCRCPPTIPQCACGEKPRIRLISKKALRPTEAECMANPRARSARLRVAERIEIDEDLAVRR